jgi:hypothetical protein
MSEKLYESDFLTVDITSMFKNSQKDPDNTPNSTESADDKKDNTPGAKEPTGKINWETELKKRIDSNKQLDKAAQIPEYEIETKFFKEYFTANWEPEYVKPLIALGEPLRKIIKTLGFGKRTNPILGFLNLKYVKESLLGPGLINSQTFKALYNAIAKKLVADSEFLRISDYNIIYCKDLYKKTAAEMEKYLSLQRDILAPSASTYTPVDQLNNKKAFVYLNSIKEKDTKKRAQEIKKLTNVKLPSVKNAVLNSYELAQAISGASSSEPSVSTLKPQEQQALISQVESISQIFAAIQYLSIITKSSKAQKALADESFKNLSTEQILQATAWLAKQNIMPKSQIKATQADDLIDALLGKLKN